MSMVQFVFPSFTKSSLNVVLLFRNNPLVTKERDLFMTFRTCLKLENFWGKNWLERRYCKWLSVFIVEIKSYKLQKLLCVWRDGLELGSVKIYTFKKYYICYNFFLGKYLRWIFLYLWHSLQVNICVDYIKPPSDGYPEKTCATVTIGTINVAEALISKGIGVFSA